MTGSYYLFRIYTNHWIAKKGLKDSIQNRANIWRHGPNSSQVKNGTATAYSLKVEKLVAASNFIETEGQKGQKQLSSAR